MRIAVLAAAVFVSIVGLAMADNAIASIRQPTHIAAQPLGPALMQLAQTRGLQVLYLSSTVRDLRTLGADGDITAEEAFDQLLTGTGLTYRYLDENTVTVVPLDPLASPAGGGVSLQKPDVNTVALQEAATVSPERYLLAQSPSAPDPPILAPAEQPAPQLAEVVVTGSRIPVPANISATSPTTILTNQEIQLQGHTDITDVINALPQNIIGTGQDFGNTSSPLTATGGFSTVDLRGLGPQRTLVLVNGRRLGAGDPSTSNQNVAPDIDQIPAPLIERVDVVTGGASATYGSDAIAGVVNFILKKDFQGIQLDGQYGFSQHDQHNSYAEDLLSHEDPISGFTAVTPPTGSIRDGYRHDLSMLMGTNFADGNGNITGYFVYHNQQPVTAYARDFSDCELYSRPQFTAVGPFTGVDCYGSSNSNSFSPETPGAAGAGNRYTVVGSSLLPWPQAASSPPAIYDFNEYEYLQREDKRYQAGFLAHDDINDYVKPYMEFGWMDDRTQAVVAPSGLFIGNYPFTSDNNELINCSNPLLSPQERSLICTPAQIAGDTANPGSAGNSADVQIGRRNIEGGGRTSIYEHQNLRLVIGTKGDVIDAWTYDLYSSYYYVNTFQANDNYLDYAKAGNALQVTTGPTGAPVCVSGGQCVPWNIFQTGGVTQAALNYLETPGTAEGNNTEQIEHIDVTGDLGKYGVKSPLANESLAANVGGEHRMDSVTFSPDGAELAGDLAGFSGASVPINAHYDINEAFAELRAPIAHDLPGAYDLVADTGYRYSDYNTTGSNNTYKFEVQYAPIQDARLRFSFDRAVRAPNLIELFLAPSYGQEGVFTTDPCAGIPTATLVQCEHTGVTPAEYAINPKTGVNSITQCVSGQCGQVIEGNDRLKPEVASTWSLGLTFTPLALPGFNASVDYYHIRLLNEISNYPFAALFNGCLLLDNPIYCSQIDRTPQGALTGASVAGGGYILQKDYNVGLSIVSGIDLIMNYRYTLPAGWGSLSAALNGAYLLHDTTTPYPGSGSYDCAGLFGSSCENGSVNPHWRHNLRLTWDTPWKLLFSAQWRFIGPTSFDNNSTNPLLAGAEEAGTTTRPYYDQYNARIPGYSYLDLTAVWHALANLELRAGVTNLLDKDPPLIPSGDISSNSGPANSYPTYDYLGRQMFAAFTAKF
jgi:outer membrane receptor protein involved in Fe transport